MSFVELLFCDGFGNPVPYHCGPYVPWGFVGILPHDGCGIPPRAGNPSRADSLSRDGSLSHAGSPSRAGNPSLAGSPSRAG